MGLVCTNKPAAEARLAPLSLNATPFGASSATLLSERCFACLPHCGREVHRVRIVRQCTSCPFGHRPGNAPPRLGFASMKPFRVRTMADCCERAPRVSLERRWRAWSSEDQPMCMMAGGVDAKEKMRLEIDYRAHLVHMQQVCESPALTYCKGAQGLHCTVGSTKALPCDFVRCRCPEMNRHLLALRHVCPSCVLHWSAMTTGNAARST